MQAIRNLLQFDAPLPEGRRHVYSEERNRERQNEAIAHIASETGRHAEDIGPLYRWVFRELEQDAQVRDYLFVLTEKRVKRMLNMRRLP